MHSKSIVTAMHTYNVIVMHLHRAYHPLCGATIVSIDSYVLNYFRVYDNCEFVENLPFNNDDHVIG